MRISCHATWPSSSRITIAMKVLVVRRRDASAVVRSRGVDVSHGDELFSYQRNGSSPVFLRQYRSGMRLPTRVLVLPEGAATRPGHRPDRHGDAPRRRRLAAGQPLRRSRPARIRADASRSGVSAIRRHAARSHGRDAASPGGGIERCCCLFTHRRLDRARPSRYALDLPRRHDELRQRRLFHAALVSQPAPCT